MVRIKLQPVRYAIVGSREYRQLRHVQRFVQLLPVGSTVVSGHAHGVDSTAEGAAEARGLKVHSIPADWDHLGKRAGFVRNADIVANADIVVAFWDGISNGTKHTIGLARQQKKPLWLCINGAWDFSGDPAAEAVRSQGTSS